MNGGHTAAPRPPPPPPSFTHLDEPGRDPRRVDDPVRQSVAASSAPHLGPDGTRAQAKPLPLGCTKASVLTFYASRGNRARAARRALLLAPVVAQATAASDCARLFTCRGLRLPVSTSWCCAGESTSEHGPARARETESGLARCLSKRLAALKGSSLRWVAWVAQAHASRCVAQKVEKQHIIVCCFSAM